MDILIVFFHFSWILHDVWCKYLNGSVKSNYLEVLFSRLIIGRSGWDQKGFDDYKAQILKLI